jgi:hypothetical protein
MMNIDLSKVFLMYFISITKEWSKRCEYYARDMESLPVGRSFGTTIRCKDCIGQSRLRALGAENETTTGILLTTAVV